MTTKGYLGIDAGTQGLSVLFTDENLNVLATSEGHYEMTAGLGEGCYEQNPNDWLAALESAMADLHQLVPDIEVLCIGISGQMHGEVLTDEGGATVGPARLWCDSRNAAEELELTERLGVKMPKRITAARWLWTTRNQKEKASLAAHLTTPSGWLGFRLTGQWNLGIGDASGMFPIDQSTMNYNQTMLQSFIEMINSEFVTLEDLLPAVRCAGEDAGTLNEAGSKILGLPPGVPVAPAEGDQPAAVAGSLIGKPGMVAVSFGTSVCANSIGDRPFKGVSNAIDHFCAVDGKPINMVWLRNGTTFMNTVVDMFADAMRGDRNAGFDAVIPKVVQAAVDCDGLLAIPFMDDEPGLGVERGGTAMLVGLNPENANSGNAVKAALLSTIFNLRMGCEILDQQDYPRTEIVLTGGLAKSPALAQILADVFGVPVKLLPAADEGTAWGAALLAKYRWNRLGGNPESWCDFLTGKVASDRQRLQPDTNATEEYELVFQRYKRLIGGNAALGKLLEPR